MYGLVPLPVAAGLRHSAAALLSLSAPSLAHLSLLDIAVIAIYFVMVIWIGFYLKGQANTSEEFFMAGREMTMDSSITGTTRPSLPPRLARGSVPGDPGSTLAAGTRRRGGSAVPDLQAPLRSALRGCRG